MSVQQTILLFLERAFLDDLGEWNNEPAEGPFDNLGIVEIEILEDSTGIKWGILLREAENLETQGLISLEVVEGPAHWAPGGYKLQLGKERREALWRKEAKTLSEQLREQEARLRSVLKRYDMEIGESQRTPSFVKLSLEDLENLCSRAGIL